jgi:hypothetical protein
MNVSADTLVDMLREIEAADPIDFGDLPFGDQELRRLIVYSLVERHNRLAAVVWASRMLRPSTS